MKSRGTQRSRSTLKSTRSVGRAATARQSRRHVVLIVIFGQTPFQNPLDGVHEELGFCIADTVAGAAVGWALPTNSLGHLYLVDNAHPTATAQPATTSSASAHTLSKSIRWHGAGTGLWRCGRRGRNSGRTGIGTRSPSPSAPSPCDGWLPPSRACHHA